MELDDEHLEEIDELLRRKQKFIPSRLVIPLLGQIRYYRGRSAAYLDAVTDIIESYKSKDDNGNPPMD